MTWTTTRNKKVKEQVRTVVVHYSQIKKSKGIRKSHRGPFHHSVTGCEWTEQAGLSHYSVHVRKRVIQVQLIRHVPPFI